MEKNGMKRLLAAARKMQGEQVAMLRRLVECESPSEAAAEIVRFNDLFAAQVADIAKVRTVAAGRYGRHLLVEFALPGPRKKRGQILALGHSDTVWPMGTLKTMPWREEKGRLWGPGVLDMRGGMAQLVFAARALRELDVPVAKKLVLQINCDEEIGSHASRELTERMAKASDAVLVLEPGTGLAGKLKTARKGIGRYGLRVEGVAAHAGVDFAAGASAILELARQVETISGFTDLRRGVTVNVGVIRGGIVSNAVASEASAEIDVRVPALGDFRKLAGKFAQLKAVDRRCKLHLEGGLNRPPMERSAGVARLAKLAIGLAREMGVEVEESSTGGGSDGNFTAALGVPTLDGLGSVGEGAHAPHESILVGRIADRTALLAGLVANV
jgi:glutamate carboxypeptidase